MTPAGNIVFSSHLAVGAAKTLPTREILWNVPLWARVLMYVSFLVASGICAYGYGKRHRIWKEGRSRPAETQGNAVRRVLRHAVLHLKIWRSPLAGISHTAIFWGFVVLFIGTAIVAIEDYGAWLLDVEHFFFHGRFYLVVSCALEVFGILFIAGLVLAMLRRRTERRFRPQARAVDAAILWLLLIIGGTGFVTEGLRIAGAGGGPDANTFEKCSFVGWGLARLFEPLGDEILRHLHLAVWLLHMALSMMFIALLPDSKLRHILLAPLQLALAERASLGRFTGVSLEEVEETGKYGVGEYSDFSRRQLLSFDACTECARCQNVCPAHATGKPLSPMHIVLDIAQTVGAKRSLHETVTPEILWTCTSCGACVEECPLLIDQLGAIVDLRRHLVGEGEIRGSEQKALRSVVSSGNPWGLPPEERLAWAAGLEVASLEDEREPEVIFWVGCAGSYDRRQQKVTRAMVRILQAAGVRFAVLGKEETCTGDPARRLGDEFTFLELATKNVETLKKAKVRRVVATCPHCFNTIKNEYPELGGSFDVTHHTQFIEELVRSGRLPLRGGSDQKVAFHDPCYLGRHNREFDAPRAVLRAAGAQLEEPTEAREKSFCCGAGGGRMWMEETTGGRVNAARWNQLKVLQPKSVAVGCPFCMTMLSDAAAADGSSIEVQDVAEVVAAQLADGAGEKRK